MSVSRLFIRRPVATTLVMLGILLFGIIAYRALPVSDLPNIDFPTLQVIAFLPGAGPETMASSVATPLEREFSTIAGLDSMTSTNTLGSTQITLQFALERDIDAAAQDVQAAIAKAGGQLPSDMPNPPFFRKLNPADQPIMYLALTSPTLPLYQLDEYGETMMAQRISMVSGVAQVQVFGSQKYAVRIRLDPDALAARKIGIDEVAAAVQRGNSNLPTGSLDGPYRAFTLESNGQLTGAGQYRPLIVAFRRGAPVRLEQLGQVLDSVENDKTAAYYIDQRSVILAVQRQPGTNTVAVADSVRQLLPLFRSELPASVSLHILYDRSVSIKGSVNDVKFTLLLALCLVVMVIFLFLRNLSATIIPSLALPMSIIGTFSIMYLLGYTVDNLSLMALTLSVGFVVDDAIVVLENIVRHMELGEGPFEAALRGSREIGFTIVSMTLSLAAVFIPVLFMGGILGRLLHEFAVTIASAILVSGFVSLTLTPMLASRFLRSPAQQAHGSLYNFFEKFFDGLLRLYEWSLNRVLKHRILTMAVFVFFVVATGYLFKILPKGFLPSEDTGEILAFTQAQQGISFDSMTRHQKAVASVFQSDPNIEGFMSSFGSRGFTASNSGIIFAQLKPLSERRLSVDEVIAQLRGKLAGIPGIMVFPQNPPPIRVGGQLTKSLYQLTLQSPNTEELYKVAPLVESKLRGLEMLADVSSDLEIKNPQINVDIDRNKASTLGITARQVENALYDAFGSREISTIYAPNNQYRVIMELERRFQRDPSALSKLYIRSSNGDLVPLGAVATLKSGVGPLSVNHTGQLPSATISFNLKPGVSLGEALERVQTVARNNTPANVSANFQGAAQVFQSSLKSLWILLLMAVLVIYIVLGILYESFIHPITILSSLPPAAFGALLTLLLFGKDLDLFAFVGIIMLIGIVKKNAIMMIDFALDAQRAEGKDALSAIYQGALIRFRPIMMTTMAALMGTLPIAVGVGAGAEARRPLGLAVVGGLIISQLVTLYVTPVFFTYMDQLQSFFGMRTAEESTLSSPEMHAPANR